jgi:hypothetical protein
MTPVLGGRGAASIRGFGMFGRISGRIEYTVQGTYSFTVPNGVDILRATVVGGGGGSGLGAINAGGLGGSGGGSGGAGRATIGVVGGDVLSIVVGNRGVQNGAGSDSGGDTTVTLTTSILRAFGGGGGQATGGSPGLGGEVDRTGAWTLTISADGLSGEQGTSTYGGAGASRPSFTWLTVSGTGGPRTTTADHAAPNATGVGAGAGGSHSSTSLRGQGAPGYVLIEWGF